MTDEEFFKGADSYGKILFPVTYHPYLVDERFKEFYGVRTGELLSMQSYWYLYLALKQALGIDGEFWECGVYRGDSAGFIKAVVGDRLIRLFDTFCGMPKTGENDPVHRKGDFNDTSLERVRQKVGDAASVRLHPGVIPASFSGLGDSEIAFAHVDVDIYQSCKDCCEFIYPRLSKGGVMLFDDYGHPSCVGARLAIEEYFSGIGKTFFNLYTYQALVIK